MTTLLSAGSPGFETRARIVAAIVELGRTAGVARIRTSDICREAGVSRQTFYRYFRDKYDALSWYNEQLFDELAHRLGRDMTFDEAGLQMLARTYEEREFYAMALRTTEDYNSLLPVVSRSLLASWRETFAGVPGFAPGGRLDFQLAALSRLGPQLIADWVLGGCDPGPHAYFELFGSCIPAELHAAVDAHVLAGRSRS